MKSSQIAAQLFTIRDYTQSAASFARSMKKLADIGFKAVQVSGVGGDIDPKEIRKICDDNGLTICATHDSQANILKNPEAVADKLDIFNCVHTAYPSPAPYPSIFIDYESVCDLAHALENSANVLASRGKVLSYHNHAIEFHKINGKRILDIIYENAPSLKAEIDTYWVQMGGCAPEMYVREYADRQQIIHLKDFGVKFGNEPTMFPVGSGNLNWEGIVAESEAAGMEWFIIEQDSCMKCPFESLSDSYHYLKDHFCK